MPSPVSPLPPDAILVHVGPHKTGTTAIQSALARSRDELVRHGTTYPGKRSAHHDPARSVARHPFGWPDDHDPAPPPRVWDRLVGQVHAAPGRVVVSSEFLAYADAGARAQLLDDLGRDRVHVLVGARNPGALAVSSWQQTVREGVPDTLEEWLEARFRPGRAVAEAGPWYDRFGAWSDPATLARRWADSAGADRVSVLVVDPTDRDHIPRSFEQLLGLPSGLLPRVPNRTNRSLTAPEMDLLIEVIGRVKGEVGWSEYSQYVRKGMLSRLVEGRRPSAAEPRLSLPPWAAEQSAERAEQAISWLQESGLRVIGDPAALRARPDDGAEDRASTSATTAVPLDLAADAIAGTIASAVRRERWLTRKLGAGRAGRPGG